MKDIIWGLRALVVIALVSIAITALGEELTLPKHLKTYIDQHANKIPTAMGTNCWATALAATRVVPMAGYMDGSQFGFWMESPLCRPLSAEDKILTGDIIAVRSTRTKLGEPYITEEHGAVYLSETQVFQKTFNGAGDVPRVMSVKEALAPYGGQDLATMRLGADEDPLKKTSPWLRFYRCQSLEQFLNEHHGDFLEATAKFWRELHFEENDLRKWTQERVPVLDVLQAASRRITNDEQYLTKILILRRRNAGLNLESSVSFSSLYDPTMRAWMEIPEWVITGLLLRFQSMNQQIQLLIATHVKRGYRGNN
ncbi:MAG: hypothetical protein KDD43_04065 [Bdellovibrionales bacterium]|nr:hypothetical protein [Bdellovibrionales bacterium]